MLAALMCLVSWQTAAGATIFRMRFQIYTMNYSVPPGNPPNQYLNIYINIGDSLQRPFDAVRSLTVYAPTADGTVFNLTNDWQEGAGQYVAQLKASDFKTGKIPGGSYKAVVVGRDNSRLTQYTTISGLFLESAIVTLPAAGSTVADLTPLIQWNPVTGAQYYSVYLGGAGASFAVYRSSFKVPPGVLKPASSYSIIVTAYDSDKNLTKLSNSASLNFKTP